MLVDYLIYSAIFLGIYFALFILITLFENREKIYKSSAKNFPRVCLIVPCYNEQENIEKTLVSLVNLDYPKEKLEVIVIDDGSEDNTFKVARNFAKKYPSIIKVFHKENGGKHTALNLGIKKTKASFVGSVDADSFLKRDALKKIMSHFDSSHTMAVISTVKVMPPKNIIEGIQYVEYLMGAFLRKIFSLVDSVNVTPGPLSVFRREVFEVLGPYRKAYQTEDLEFAFRLQRANFKIAHAIDAVVYTKPCPTLKLLLRQRLRWRRGFLLNLRDYLDLLNMKRHGNLSFLLYYNLIGSFLSTISIFYAIWRMGDFFFQKIEQVLLVGIHPSFTFNKFDLFFFNTNPLFFFGILSLLLLVLFFIFSKKLTLDKKSIKKEAVFYLLFYAFLNVSWWILAIGSIVFKGKKDVFWK